MQSQITAIVYQLVLHDLKRTELFLTLLYKHYAICCVLLLLTYGESLCVIKYEGFKNWNTYTK